MTDTVLEKLLDESRRHTGGEPTAVLRKASSAFLSRADSDPTILITAANALPTLSPPGAGWLALVLGTAVERGTDPALTLPRRCSRRSGRSVKDWSRTSLDCLPND